MGGEVNRETEAWEEGVGPAKNGSHGRGVTVSNWKLMKRRTFLGLATVAPTALLRSEGAAAHKAERPWKVRNFEWEEATIAELQAALVKGSISSLSLTREYLGRIRELDSAGPKVNSVIEINPEALAIARELDRERKAKGPRGPMHGIPVLLKDNIATHDRMMTTAGSLALLGSIAPEDAFIVRKLREAGAVILGKTNLSEWANFRSNRSTSGWSGRGGLTHNPYALDRNTSGSSSGSGAAVSANFCSVAVGTETDGSIVSPSSACGIVGLKPTVGLLSRFGIIPISASQDTAGPMARTVRDAAILLGAMAGVDPKDAATQQKERQAHPDYAKFLDPQGLKGARIGVARQSFRLRSEPAQKLIERALEEMKRQGAVLVDPANIPTSGKFGDSEFEGMLYEFKDGLNKYFQWLGPGAPVGSLKELIAFNESNRARELRYFGQETLVQAEAKGPLTEKAYLDAVEKNRRLARTEGIDGLMNEHHLDAIVAPSAGPAHRTDLVYGDRDIGGSSSAAAVAGYPNITLPVGYVNGLPVGISFFGRAWSEAVLLKIAYSFEQATKARQKPEFHPSVGEA